MRIRDLNGLGEKSEIMLAAIGVNSVENFLASDPFVLYASLKDEFANVGVNFLYAIIGAQEDKHWQEIAKKRKTEILMRLDDMGIAPKWKAMV